MSFPRAAALALSLAFGLAAAVHAQPFETAVTAPEAEAQLAIRALAAKPGRALVVSSPAFADGGDIPFENTRWRGNRFPGLSWTPGPRGVKAYAVIMQTRTRCRLARRSCTGRWSPFLPPWCG